MRDLKNFAEQFDEEWKSLLDENILREIQENLLASRRKEQKELKNLRNDFGIYAFYIKPKNTYSCVEDLKNNWNIDGFKKYPKVVKKRFEVQEPCEAGWFSLYIGKGEKLKNRIDEHLNHPPTHATYGLKLSKRVKFLDDNDIEIGFWHLPEMPGVSREIKQFIITNLESRLRDELKPWIGKQ
jgi:hypothetical protein